LLRCESLLKHPKGFLGHVLIVRQASNFGVNEVVLGIFQQNVHVDPNEVLFYQMLARGHD
jgi:hypothetical protein